MVDNGNMALVRPSRPPRVKPPLPPGAERRRFERFELLAQVELRRRDEVALIPVVNISAGGMLLRVEGDELSDLDVDERQSVYLDVGNFAEPISLAMEATVVRVMRDGDAATSVAVMWSSVNGTAIVQLAKLLDYVREGEGQRALGDGQR